MHNATVYQLHVTLVHSVPPVWRRLRVTGETPLHRLHQILQVTMDWDDTSPHEFEIDGTSYGELFDAPQDDLRDEYGVRLDTLLAASGADSFVYRYDFAAGWELQVEVEALHARDAQAFYPQCTDGALASPPERCAGIAGYHQLRAALDLPGDPQHGEAVDWLGDPFDPEALNAEFEDLADSLGDDLLPPLPVYADAELAALDEAALIELLRRAGDRAPRNLIDACAARGATMVQALAALLDTDDFWGKADGEADDEADHDAWWLAQHAALIAGLIPGEAAGQLLVDLLEGICRNEDEATEEWLAPWWPALFANKPPALAAPLRALVMAHECNIYFRANVAAACVRLAAEAGAAELEDALDWLAALVADETQDWDCRLMLSQSLLDLPRARHRPLLEALAASQQGPGVAFTGQDVREAYGAGGDRPEWARFDDPWAFYRPENIAERQRRWASERYGFADDPEDDALWPDDSDAWPDATYADDAWVQPYVRSEPKIGRNDPCPCGSGKKYKKCCLGKTG